MKTEHPISLWRRAVLAGAAFTIATAAWLPAAHFFFRPAQAAYHADAGIAPMARQLAARHLDLWENPDARQREIARMRTSNAEWDFMGRTYLVLALCEMSLREPANQPRYLAVADQILDETLRLERDKGMYFFLMDYSHASPWVAKPARSIFIDGEIALMLAARQKVAPSTKYAPQLAERVNAVVAQMQQGPVMCAESYPDECWMFCNTLAVSAVKISDQVDGRDHSPFIARWLDTVKHRLVDEKSGMLVSSFNYNGTPMDGPEGSSIWMIAHCLKIIDPAFAEQQYRLARAQLARNLLGFGYAREWPETWKGPADVDSGPIVPGLEASAGASGLAILGAASFGDDQYLGQLLTSLDFAGFPTREKDTLRYGASNQVGDAVLLYALVQGPMWDHVRKEARP